MGGHELAMALRGAYLALHRRTDAALARSGVTADQFVVLAALMDGDALTQRELVARTASDPNTLRAMLVLLERQGLVARRPNPADRRARSVALTARGRRLFPRLWRQTEPLRGRLLAAVGAGPAGALVEHLRGLTAALDPEPRSERGKLGAGTRRRPVGTAG